MPVRDDDWQELDDEEFADSEDTDNETPTMICSRCGATIFDEAEQCPACGTYLTEEETTSPPKRWWIVVGTVACLGVVYLWIRYRM